MAFDINNFVIDRVIRGVALSQKDDSVLFSINQMQNVSLNCASESTDAVDALGTPIATFYRAKSAEFSAENAIFDMNLMATQLGADKKVASADAKIVAPAMESFVYGNGSYELKHTPKVAPNEIYILNGDSTFGKKFTKATSAASATEFAITNKTLALPTGLNADDELFVMYDYETDSAVEVVNSATKFPVGCKFIMEVLGCDVCDQTTLIHCYLIFPNFKLSPDFDWSVATDGAHPFSGKAQQAYCDKEKKLFSIIIPEEKD
jgi:hypothetical protein|nr:MAG TPA_asm: putative structural protein [Caudoviricetes sp.]